MAVAQLSVLARKVGAASPVVMLVAGVVIAFMLGVPTISLDPDLVLLAFLPPLIYSSGVGMSWRGLRSNMRPILLMSIGCVLFTASAVAAVAHYIVGLSWALGFVLGAIVSPPDLVAPMAVLKSMRHPRRLMTVLEGESLVNDATALVTLSFALEGVASGAFSPSAAASRFLLIVVGELGFGCAVGFVMLHLRDVVADPRAEVLLALATPFLTFWPPHELGGGRASFPASPRISMSPGTGEVSSGRRPACRVFSSGISSTGASRRSPFLFADCKRGWSSPIYRGKVGRLC